jgi:hypothetical protein
MAPEVRALEQHVSKLAKSLRDRKIKVAAREGLGLLGDPGEKSSSRKRCASTYSLQPPASSLPARALILSGLIAASAALLATNAAASCLDYGYESLSGTLVRQTYPGPPEYESLSKGDEPQVIWILQLDHVTCFRDSGSRYAPVYDREIQIVTDSMRDAELRNLLGKRVVVTGELFRGGARHDKRLVISARDIARIR